ncbi:hypothetical protein MPER_08836 [Moniliophthora perniciosa FA553]|nr:hypothetical protein MPER_08836 [Moniliophthora perniciosa FA553]
MEMSQKIVKIQEFPFQAVDYFVSTKNSENG